MYINSKYITSDMIERVSDTLSTSLNNELLRYIALGYSVKHGVSLFDSMSVVELGDIPYFYYTNIVTELGYDKYMNEIHYDIDVKSLESFFNVDNKSQQIIFDSFLEIPVDIGLHFNLYLSYYVTLEDNNILKLDLIGFKFYLNEINTQKVEDGEIYLDIEYLNPNFEDMGVYVISDSFEMLENYLFIDFKFNTHTNKLCFCSSGKELL